MPTKDIEREKTIAAARESLPHVYIDDMLMTLKYFVDEKNAHLKIKSTAVCLACREQPCLYFCPVGAYRAQEDGTVQIAYQSCIECGSCRIACPPNNVSWTYPPGGFGVAFKFG